MHEGGGAEVVGAYVEIVFDNGDNRFPTGKPEVVIRRTVTLSKDEYSLDRKAASKNDIVSLLESAGFSKANPYYIVPQGRITALTNAKDSERLKLLKEVAGTQVYESRRSESQKILEETSVKRAKIDELLRVITDRLAELEDEKKELKEYQESENTRKCVEYTMYDRELRDIVQTLESIEEERAQEQDLNEQGRETFIEREMQVEALDAKLRVITAQVELLAVERSQLANHKNDIVSTRAEFEVRLNKLESQDRSEATQIRLREELEALEQAITEEKEMIRKVTNDYLEAARQEEQCQQR